MEENPFSLFRMKSVSIQSPVSLRDVRSLFERTFAGQDFDESAISGNLSLVGIISGYRRLQTDPDFSHVFLEVSQGSNEEFRLNYIGKMFWARN